MPDWPGPINGERDLKQTAGQIAFGKGRVQGTFQKTQLVEAHVLLLQRHSVLFRQEQRAWKMPLYWVEALGRLGGRQAEQQC